MILRHVTTVHVLPVRNSQGYQEFLTHPHARWGVQALPTKKLVEASGAGTIDTTDTIDPDELRAVFDVLWHQEMGLDLEPGWYRILPTITTRIVSPTRGEVTEYRIVPVLGRVNRREYRAVESRLQGAWQRRGELLEMPTLSPTARLALGQLQATPNQVTPPPQDGNWTQRLLWCIEHRDRNETGRLLLDMERWLRAQLNRCPQTRILLQNEADVEDILAETSINVLLNLEGFIETASAGAWVWTIAYNTAISLLRQRSRRAAVSLSTSEGEMPVLANEGDVLVELEVREDRNWQQRLIAEVLATSDPLHRRAWELRHREGWQFNEIAEELQANPNTVVGWIRRITQRLEQRGRQDGPGR